MQGLGLDGVAIASHPTPDVLIHPGDTRPHAQPRLVRHTGLGGRCLGL